jgi:hypothetical protein
VHLPGHRTCNTPTPHPNIHIHIPASLQRRQRRVDSQHRAQVPRAFIADLLPTKAAATGKASLFQAAHRSHAQTAPETNKTSNKKNQCSESMKKLLELRQRGVVLPHALDLIRLRHLSKVHQMRWFERSLDHLSHQQHVPSTLQQSAFTVEGLCDGIPSFAVSTEHAASLESV